jgi:hypothetical protein
MTAFATRASAPGRNMDLQHLADLLREQSIRALDVIAGTGAIHAEHGHLVLDGTEPVLGPDGVTMTAGSYALNDVALAGVADKLNIPLAYLRRMREQALDLFDTNINGWLARMDRRLLIRVLRDEAGSGVARAVLSDRYAKIDNLDAPRSIASDARSNRSCRAGLGRSAATVWVWPWSPDLACCR